MITLMPAGRSRTAIVANGYAGNDTLITAGGNDTLIGGEGNDTLNGGGGRDRASYADATGAISVDMAGGTVTGPDVGTDTLVSIEFVQGSASADTYVATGYAGNDNLGSLPTTNAFEGMGGDDTITGNGSTILQYFNATAGVTVEFTDGTAGTAYSTNPAMRQVWELTPLRAWLEPEVPRSTTGYWAAMRINSSSVAMVRTSSTAGEASIELFMHRSSSKELFLAGSTFNLQRG